MTKRMLIDATHAEETRVVVLDGSRLEDFDVETAAKRQLKGNIYLAKVVRVEPSLQAAFVEYGGGRHGFLAFGEIHPDYYQIPVADRQRLLEMQEAEARAEEEADDAAAAADEAAGIDGPAEHEGGAHEMASSEPLGTAGDDDAGLEQALTAELVADEDALVPLTPGAFLGSDEQTQPMPFAAVEPPLPMEEPGRETTQAVAMAQDFLVARDEIAASETEVSGTEAAEVEIVDLEAVDTILAAADAEPTLGQMPQEGLDADAPGSETSEPPMSLDAEPIGLDDAAMETHSGQQDAPAADAHEDEPRDADSRPPARFMRSYKIQEVIRRRQILLIQVVKEERGSKGAALTTYISLAGRFSVLMPNSPRGGGISRKITSTADRRRLKEVTSELQIPRGMGLIVRTAGANRPKAEIKRDCEYLLELWDSIRDTTMASMAPALIHEEANLIKRAIRDNYSRDVDEVLVDGETGWRAARDFMRMLMPAHARKVILWNDPQPLFARNQVEAQLDAMLVPTVQLKSGGYLVINQTEALVAIDVNSGRSTRERGIEETALKTNLEAADEVARQLRLRDLAGLIVIDFIDMESRRNNTAVEKRMKDALKDDRARIQLGAISQFGLMELSRQRLRPSLAETSFTPCPHCGGTGHVRSTETSALAVLRAIEDEGAKRRAAEIVVHVAGAIALYVLNHKRVRIAEIEARYGMSVAFAADESLLPPETRIEKIRAQLAGEASVVTPIPISTVPIDDEDDVTEEDDVEAEDEPVRAALEPSEASDSASAEATETAERGRKRRRRRGGRREEGELPGQEAQGVDPASAEQPDLPMATADGVEMATGDADPAVSESAQAPGVAGEPGDPLSAAEEERGRRRGRRGGRRRRRDVPGELGEVATSNPEGAGPEDEGLSSFDEPAPVYAGPTPADPFGGGVFDIYDAMERAEALAAAPPAPEPPPLATPQRPESEAAAAEATVPLEASEPEPVQAVPEPMLELSQPAPVAVEPVMAEAPEPEVHEHGAPEPVLDAAVTATPPTPPTLIGANDAGAEKKRGWWRR